MTTSMMATKFVARTSGVHTSRVRVSPRLGGARAARVQARRNLAVRCDVPEPVVISEEAKADAEEKKDVLDPADGTVAYGGPMGEDGTENLNSFGESFFNWRSAEILNGRVGMVGFLSALLVELDSHVSLSKQVVNTRTFALLDETTRTVSYPNTGFYLAVLSAVVIVVASYVPKFKGVEDNGMDKPPSAKVVDGHIARFTPDIEMLNGRAAMMGIIALYITEMFLGHAEF